MSCNGTYNTYDISDPVELLATLELASSGTPYDPNVVRLKLLAPGNVLSTYVYGTDPDLLKNGAGDYSLITYPPASGIYTYRWEVEDASANARVGAEEGQFCVRYSLVVPGIPANGGDGMHGFDGGTP